MLLLKAYRWLGGRGGRTLAPISKTGGGFRPGREAGREMGLLALYTRDIIHGPGGNILGPGGQFNIGPGGITPWAGRVGRFL